jgi:acetyltransferase-like isoleucine patch superfamily enzyme
MAIVKSIKQKSILRKILNRLLHVSARVSPGATTLRPFLHRLRGVKIAKGVFIGDEAYLENEYPECIEIHEGAQIGIRTILLAHIRGTGRIVIERNVWIGPNCVIATSPDRELRIGEGAVIGAASVITSSVPAKAFYSSDRARHIANVSMALTDDVEYSAFLRGLVPIRGPVKKNEQG